MRNDKSKNRRGFFLVFGLSSRKTLLVRLLFRGGHAKLSTTIEIATLTVSCESFRRDIFATSSLFFRQGPPRLLCAVDVLENHDEIVSNLQTRQQIAFFAGEREPRKIFHREQDHRVHRKVDGQAQRRFGKSKHIRLQSKSQAIFWFVLIVFLCTAKIKLETKSTNNRAHKTAREGTLLAW